MLSAGLLLSNLRPWRPRCVRSPSWRQVTSDCGCGPILPETPVGAPTGWSPWRCYCGDWWSWRRWPRRGLGCNALRKRHRGKEKVGFTCLGLLCASSTLSWVWQSETITGLVLTTCAEQSLCHCNQLHSPALWLRQGRTEQTNTLTCPPPLSTQLSQGHTLCTRTPNSRAPIRLWSAHKRYGQYSGLRHCDVLPVVEEVFTTLISLRVPKNYT